MSLHGTGCARRVIDLWNKEATNETTDLASESGRQLKLGGSGASIESTQGDGLKSFGTKLGRQQFGR